MRNIIFHGRIPYYVTQRDKANVAPKKGSRNKNASGRKILNFLTIPGGIDRDVEDGVVGVPLHEAPHAQHVAGEGEAAPRPAAPERGVGAVVHLVKPVRRVRELALNRWQMSTHMQAMFDV